MTVRHTIYKRNKEDKEIKEVKEGEEGENEFWSDTSAFREADISESPPTRKHQKHKHGEYNNVLLTDDELEVLQIEFSDYKERIDRLSGYIASTGKVYKSHFATIRNWAKKDRELEKTKKRVGPNGIVLSNEPSELDDLF